MDRAPTQYVVLDLPPSVSTNCLWYPVIIKGKAQLVKSATYKAWIAEAGYALNTQRPGKVEGPYVLTILLPDSSKLDADNSVKCVSDLLQAHGVIVNDKLAREVRVKRGDYPEMKVTVVSTTRKAE